MYKYIENENYVKCTGKVRVSKQYFSFKEVQPWVKKGGQVGLIIPKGTIVLDADTKKDADSMLKIIEHCNLKCGIHKTNKGYHFIFKDNKPGRKQAVKQFNALGINLDSRVTGDNYIILPINDSSRKVIREYSEDCDVVPDFAIPSKNGAAIDTSTGKRNDQFQRHAWRLRALGHSKESVREILLLINECLMDEPLSVSELANTVLRDENLELVQPRTKFVHNVFADELLQKLDIITIKGNIYEYSGGVYVPCNMQKIIISVNPSLKRSQRSEVIDYISVVTEVEREVVNMANTKSFFMDRNGNKVKHSKLKAVTTQCNFYYDETAYDEATDKFISDICSNDVEKRQLLLEMIGSCMFDDVKDQKMFILHGQSASNGKSTFVQVLRHLIGNVSSVALEDISKGGFLLPKLEGSLLNVGTELENEYLKNVRIIKAVTGGDVITIDKKHEAPYEIQNFATFVFATNELPEAKIDKGLARRFMIIDFINKFSSDSDFDIKNVTHQDALNYLGTQALDAYVEKCKRKEWSYKKQSNSLLTKYITGLDSVLQFLNENEIKDGTKAKEAYNSYQYYCISNGLTSKSSHKFRDGVREDYDIKKATVDNETADRIYAKRSK